MEIPKTALYSNHNITVKVHAKGGYGSLASLRDGKKHVISSAARNLGIFHLRIGKMKSLDNAKAYAKTHPLSIQARSADMFSGVMEFFFMSVRLCWHFILRSI
uniref:Uncharacterized protein n=1 Tax=Candidatus Kentrum sp. TC TaxID=2126339 RepID=A0A450ZJ41_9GAMM|nr:MAG: hypothetical protein BECKTC1821F_GA0114240_100376 [Candidatus Kentron sp. TC]